MIQSILAHIKQGKLWRFAGGVFPSERKGLSNQQPILPALIPSELIIPLNQHIGEPADLLVNVGDKVLKGQALTRHNNFRSLPIHASTSGTVTAIEARPSCHPSGIAEMSVVITPDGQDTWIERHPIADISELDRHAIIDKIHLAGIAGKGGAGFPAHLKLSGKADIELLIINGIECEPYITADDMLMREYARELIQGIEIIERVTQCKQTVIAIESNKPEAIAALSEFNNEQRRVTVVPTKYPSGGEKQLIEVITGKQVPNKGYPIDMGILMHNVGTAFAIKRAVIDDEPLISRVVTITGEAFEQRGNVHALIGTPIEQLVAPFNLQPQGNQTRLIIGGPMMGFTLPSASAPVIKTTNCILAPTEQELPTPGQEMACIRCGECADACPASLLPQQLYWYAKSNDHEKLREYNLFDCIECGSCAYVCPSEIPLVQYYRIGKADIRQQEQEAKKAEIARIRHESRQARLEREKEEREARNKAAAEKRRAQILANQEKSVADIPANPEGNDAKVDESLASDAVAQALARAKAKRDAEPHDDIAAARKARKEQARLAKLAKQAQTEDSPTQQTKAEATSTAKTTNPAVAAALARAKAKKEAQQGEQPITQTDSEPAPSSAPSKNSAVAAAIARAKAKKAAQQSEAETETEAKIGAKTESEPEQSAAPTKNPAVAAAIARAKAKKAAQQSEAEAATEAKTEAEPEQSAAPTKNPAVAAAIARAKAKKAAQQSEAETEAKTEVKTESEPEQSAAPTKNPAVAAAIARAKAKKAAQQSEAEAATEAKTESEPEQSAAPTKNPAVAAAIARAKAKKAAQQSEKAEAQAPQPDSQKDNR